MQADVSDSAQRNTFADRGKVRRMFDQIAPRYDLLNTLLSLGIHKCWKRRLVRKVMEKAPRRILDVAAGTCDLAILAARRCPEAIVAVDLSENMLAEGKRKIHSRKLDGLIETRVGDAVSLPFADDFFDAAMVGFGVRNFEQTEASLREIRRVLEPGARFCVLEFALPEKFPVRPLFRFYFSHVLPLIGRMISHDANAYTYLPESVERFPARTEFTRLLLRAGFQDAGYRNLSLGIACLYTATK